MNPHEQKAQHALDYAAHLLEVEQGGFACKSRDLTPGESKVQEAAEAFLYYYFQAPVKRAGARRKKEAASTNKKAPIRKKQ